MLLISVFGPSVSSVTTLLLLASVTRDRDQNGELFSLGLILFNYYPVAFLFLCWLHKRFLMRLQALMLSFWMHHFRYNRKRLDCSYFDWAVNIIKSSCSNPSFFIIETIAVNIVLIYDATSHAGESIRLKYFKNIFKSESHILSDSNPFFWKINRIISEN